MAHVLLITTGDLKGFELDLFSSVTIYSSQWTKDDNNEHRLCACADLHSTNKNTIVCLLVIHTHTHTKNSYSRVHTQNNTEKFAVRKGNPPHFVPLCDGTTLSFTLFYKHVSEKREKDQHRTKTH